MNTRSSSRLGKRKLEIPSNEDVICLSSDEDVEEEEEDFDDDESSYLETEDSSCESSSVRGDDEDTLDISSNSERSTSIRELNVEVLNIIEGGGDLNKLTLDHCKAYLRKHDLKLSGSKAVLLARIQEHLKIQDGDHQVKDRRSMFRVNSTGGAISFQRKVNVIEEGDLSEEHVSRVESPTLNDEEQDFYAEAMKLINDGGDLEKLKVEHCRAYLRRYGLRLTGSKAVLLERIREHLEIKDGGGLHKYPRSTFTVNCKGDVCTGDVVLFEQKVYDKYDIVSRSSVRPPLGKRVVAGRIVKESYGAEKQQHTFTVEVLWSTGFRALPTMYPLIIKGRNLYRFKNLRQPWPNEEDRRRVLQEKHNRGTVARSARVARIDGKKHHRTSHKHRVTDKTSRIDANFTKRSAGKKQKRSRGGQDEMLSEGQYSEAFSGLSSTVPEYNDKNDHLGDICHFTHAPVASLSNLYTTSLAGTTDRHKTAISKSSVAHRNWMHVEDRAQNYTTTVSNLNMTIKASVAGIVIGRHGANVKEINRVSGAKLQIREDKTDPTLRVVEIKGTPEQIQRARDMVSQSLVKKGFAPQAPTLPNMDAHTNFKAGPHGSRDPYGSGFGNPYGSFPHVVHNYRPFMR